MLIYFFLVFGVKKKKKYCQMVLEKLQTQERNKILLTYFVFWKQT